MADHLGLLVNLLRHEVAVVALVDEKGRGERARDRPLDSLAVAVADGDAGPSDHGPVAVGEIGDGVGEGRERDRIGAHEHLATAEAERERAALPRHDHQIVVAAENHGERERALEALQAVVHGAHRIVAGLELARNEMGDDFGVGVAGEGRAVGDELVLQRAKILDDAVMDDRDQLGHVRMRVRLDRLAVGGPAGMTDAGAALKRRPLDQLLEIA